MPGSMRPVVFVKLSLLNISLSFTSVSAFHLRIIGRYEGAEKKAVAKNANTNIARRYGIGRFLIKLTTETLSPSLLRLNDQGKR